MPGMGASVPPNQAVTDGYGAAAGTRGAGRGVSGGVNRTQRPHRREGPRCRHRFG